MKIAIFAEGVNRQQLEYLKQLAANNGIEAQFVIEEADMLPEEEVKSTPITGELLDNLTEQFGRSPLEWAQLAREYGIETIEDALNHERVPSDVKEMLESWL